MHKNKFYLLGAVFSVLLLLGVTACTPADIQAFEGTLQNVDSASGTVTVTMKDGSTRTFNFNDVKVETIRQALGSATLEVGDQVTVKIHQNGDIDEVDVRRAEVNGTVKSLGTNSLTVTAENQIDVTLQVSSDIVVRSGDNTAAFSDVQVGQEVAVKYEVTTLKALRIVIGVGSEDNERDEHENNDEQDEDESRSNEMRGIVSAYANNSITVNGKTITLNQNTRVNGTIAVGANVVISLIRGEDNVIARTITLVTAGTTTPPTVPPTRTVTIPVAPSNLLAAASGSSQVNLSWTDNSNNETGFKLQRATNNTFTLGLATISVGAGVTSYVNTGLAASTTYYYRVIANNSAGYSAPSNTANATTAVASTTISGAAVFSANCTGCHGLSTATATYKTQSQLQTWLANHNTGSNVTIDQLAALAAYIKP